MPVLVTCKFDKYLIKGDWEKLEIIFFGTQGHVTPKWLVRSGRNLNPSNISCLSLLPVSLMKIEFIVTEKKWRHHFLHYKSMGKNLRAQGQITPKWIIRSGPNSNLFELLCLSSLPASLTKIQSKVTEKSWRPLFFHHSRARNSKITGQIRPKFELVRDFTPVLVTSKFDEDWIHSNWEKMETSFFPIQSQWERSRANNSVVKSWTWPKFEFLRDFMPVLITCKFDKDPIKKVTEKMRGHRFAHYMSMGAFCCHGNHSFDPICPKT